MSMSFSDFYDAMEILARGSKTVVFCYQDKNRGVFTAVFDDGTRITMPKGEWKITANWGSGHTATKDIREILAVAV